MNIQGKIFLVGGAVRDTLLGKPVNDHDYVVVGGSQANLLANGFKQVGTSFPVFLHPTTGAEYALARVERKTGLGYGGFEVHTEGVTLEQDLARRDFTINAMALPIDAQGDFSKLIDPFNGAADLKAGIIRHVTNAFKDDPLRVLRAARFAARYNFEVAPATLAAIKLVTAEELNALPAERILLELEKAIKDGELPIFFTYLVAMEVGYVLEAILCSWGQEQLTWAIPKGFFKPDSVLTVLCMLTLEHKQPLADMPAISSNNALAGAWLSYINEPPALKPDAMERLLNALGKQDSVKFNRLFDALRVLTHPWPGDADKLIQAADLVEGITSASILLEHPGLEGPDLGAAIKAARIKALKLL